MRKLLFFATLLVSWLSFAPTQAQVAKIGSDTFTSLQAALDAAHEMTGDVTVELTANTSGYSIVHQKAGLNLTVDGKDKTLNGQIIIDGDARYNGEDTLTIKNIHFSGNKSDFLTGPDPAFILVCKPSYVGNKTYNYAHNITISNCSFTSTSNSYEEVGFRVESNAGCNTVVMNNCTGTSLHSFGQIYGTKDVEINNCSATDTGSFIGINNGTGTYKISNCSFESADWKTDGYAYREKNNSTAEATLTNNNFKAYDAISLGSAGSINIESGTYTGRLEKTAGTLNITGGTFSADPSDYVADGYSALQSGDGYIVVEGNPVAQVNGTYYESIAAAVEAAIVGDVIKVIKAGEYTLPGLPKYVTIEGAVDGVVFNHTGTGNIAAIPTGATFKNVTFNFGDKNYHGFQGAGTIDMEGCTINGKFFSYGDMNFTNCTFVQTVSDYHMWVYGKGTVKYTNCTFTGLGKFLHLYSESSTNVGNVIVTGCKFINNGSATKAALNVKATCGSTLLAYDVTINNCTTEGPFPAASTSDALVVISELVQVDDRTADGKDNITVTLDGVRVYPAPIAKIGDVTYSSLEEAWAAVEDGQTITLLADCAGNGIIAPQGKFSTGVTIDFGGFTYTVDGTTVGSTGTETQAFQLLKDNKITFKNGKIYSEVAKMLVQNYSNLTLENMTLTLNNADYASAYTLSNNNGNVVIDGTTINANPAGGFAFDVCRYASYPSVKVTVQNGSTINGSVEISASANDAKDGFGLALNGGTMTGEIVLDASAAAAMAATPNKVSITKADSFVAEAPAGYKWESNGGTSTLVALPMVAQIGEAQYYSLQKAVDAAYATTGDITIELLDDIAEYAIVKQKADLNLTIDGKDKTMSGNIVVDGMGRHNGSETLTIQNIKFEGDKTNLCSGTSSFVEVPSLKTSGTPYYTNGNNYAHNITIKDCSFTSTSSSLDVVAFKSNNGGGNCYNLVIKDVTAINLHSFAQLNSSVGATFDNCTATQTGSFISVSQGNGDYIISNCTFESHPDKADGYAYREQNSSTVVATLTNNNFKAYDAILLKCAGTINIESGTYIGNVSKTAGSIVISGGQFSADLTDVIYEPFIAEGKIGIQNNAVEGAPYSVEEGTYVAQVTLGESTHKYVSLEAAFAAATDGATVTLLADASGNGIQVPQGKYTTGLTVDFGGFTYTMDGAMVGSTGTQTQAFQLLKDNTITFKNGTINSSKALMLIQNYSNLTLEGMTLTLNNPNYTSAYTLSNNNGTVVIDGSTIKANPAGGFAFDVCRYSSYPSVSVEVKGNSTINGDIEISASGNDAKDGFGLKLTSGTLTGNIVLDETAKAAMAATPEKAVIKKAETFEAAAPADYKWVSDGEGTGTSTLAPKVYVAQIGEGESAAKYESLAEAVAAATDGATITLIADDNISLTTAGSEITINKPLTITGAVDENGVPMYTIYGSSNGALNNGSFNDLFLSCSTGTVTVSNIKFDGFGNGISSVMGHSPIFIGSNNNNAVIENVYISNLNCEGIHINGGEFTIQNCNIDCSKTTTSVFTKGICVVNAATGTIEGTTITGVNCEDANDTSAAIELQGSGEIVISGCTIESETMGIAVDGPANQAGSSSVTVSDCTVEADLYALYGNGENGGVINVLSGTYNGMLSADDEGAGLNISGGTFEDEILEEYCAKGYIPSTLENGKYSVKLGTYVAQVLNGENLTKYESLEAAFAAAEDGATITLLASCAGNGIFVGEGKFTQGVTVDFGGFTYTVDGTTVGSTGTQTQAFHLEKNNTFTFKNGTITSENAKMLVQNYSNLTLEGMTLTLNNPNYTSAYTLSNNNGTVVIDGSTIKANPAGGFAFDVCRYAGYTSVNVEVKGESVINGNIEISASGNDAKDGFGLALNGGTLNGNIVLDASAKAAMAATPDKVSITKADSFEATAPADYKWVPAEEEGYSTLAPKVYVAQIGDVKYESLKDAVAAAQSGETITVIADHTIDIVGSAITIPAGKSITIDLNGYQVVGTAEGGSTSALITNRGTLTIKDSSDTNADGTGTGKLISGANPTWTWDGSDNYAGSYASNTIDNRESGTLIIESGYIKNLSTGSATYAIDNYNSAKIIINGGIVDAAKASAIRMFYVNGGSVTVNGGVVGHYTSDDDCSYMGIQVMGGSNVNVTVTGGTINGQYTCYANNTGGGINISGGTLNGKYALYASNAGGNVAISGGTLNGSYALLANNSNGNVTISGGSFNGHVGFYDSVPNISITDGLFNAWVGTWGSQTGFISGGIYASRPDEEYCATGYIPVANTDPETKEAYPYTVREGQFVAQIVSGENTYKYETLEEAITDAEAGETITLLEDIDATAQIEVGKQVTLDLNGKTIEYTSTTTLSSGVIMVLRGGDLTVTDSSEEKTGAIKSGTKAYAGIALTKAGETSTDAAKLTVDSGTIEGYYYGITGNGSRHGTEITITGGTIKGTCEGDNLGIFHPQDGTLTITGGTITGYSSAVEMRAGTLDVTGGTLTATAESYSYTGNGSGTTTVGAAVAIAPHNTGKAITANITGGTLDGNKLISVVDAQNNNLKDVTVNANNDFIANTVIPEDYKWVDTEEEDISTLAPKDYVAQIEGGAKYESLEAAFAAATDGAIITLLDDCAGNGISVNKNVTVDFAGKTYTITGPSLAGSTGTQTQAFQLLQGKNITFKNGAIVANNNDIQMMIQNYANLTLDNMVLDATQGTNTIVYVLSTNYGNTTINNTTITAKADGIAFDACTGWGGYTGNNVEVKGTSVINGDIEVSFYGQGTAPTLTITSGTINGGLVMEEGADQATITKNDNVALGAPEDYMWVSNGDGTSTLGLISDQDIVLNDWESYTFTKTTQVKSVTYNRRMQGIAVNNWAAWYVPFDYTITADDLNDIKFYKINLIANAAEEGEVSTDKVYVFVTQMNAGDKLYANRPYLFKSTKSGELSFTTTNTTLYAPVNDSPRLENSTSFYTYEFFGTTAKTPLTGSNYYFIGSKDNSVGITWPLEGETKTIGAYRWYIKATPKDNGGPYAPVFIFTEDDDDATGISQNDNVVTEVSYYNLSGMRINKPARGTYIIKYSDGSVKKVAVK